MWYRKPSRRKITKSAPRRAHGKHKNNLSLERLDDRRMLTVNFQFNALAGTPQNVVQGFRDAGQLWQGLLNDNITVVVDIGTEDFVDPTTIGSTSNNALPFSYTAVRNALQADSTSVADVLAVSNLSTNAALNILINRTSDNPNGAGSNDTYVDNDGGSNNTTLSIPRANAKALGLPVPAGSDGSIKFDTTTFNFDFDRTDGITPGTLDFVFIAAHEIGHLLGFESNVDDLDFADGIGTHPPVANDNTFNPTVLDLFRTSDLSIANGADLDFAVDNRVKFFSPDTSGTFSTGKFHGDGNQASHWKDTGGTALGIMDPNAANGEFGVVTGLDLKAFDVIGWDLALDDAFEPNNTIGSATPLGSETEVTLRDLTVSIDDEDFFQYTAHSTGQLVVNALFDDAAGDIDLEILDAQGKVLGFSKGVVDNETVTIPVVSGQKYFIHVVGFPDFAVNTYALEVENFAAPVPTGVDLDPASDTGSSNNDNITQDTTPTFSIQSGVLNFVDVNHNDVIDPGVPFVQSGEVAALSAAQAIAGTTPGIAVEVTLINTSNPAQAPIVGFADPISTTLPTVYRFTPSAPLPQGVYLVSSATKVFDGQTTPVSGRSGPSEPLVVTIDTTAPTSPAPVLLASSDSGTFNDDEVTNIIQPAFDGTAELRSKVSIFAQPINSAGAPTGNARLVGQGVVGSELSDGVPDNGLGQWEVTVEPLANGRYNIFTRFEDAAGVISPDSEPLVVVIDTVEPNTPLLDLLSDSGRNSVDDLTNTPRPTVTMRGNATTTGGATNPPPNDVIFRLYARPDGSSATDEILVYNSFTDPTLGGGLTTSASLQRTISLTLNNSAGTPLPDGTYNFKLEVEDRAGNISHDFLLPVIIDSTSPPVSFGIPTNLTGLVADSDTGSPIDPNLASDLITSDTTPKFAGQAEANAIVRIFADLNNNGSLDPTDQLVGQATAIPLDGNQAEPVGYWEIQSTVDVNQIFATRDGLRRFFVTAIDPAGNETGIDGEEPPEGQILEIFIDTQGPRVGNVLITDNETFDLFAPKPQTQGPTPLVNSLTIRVEDFPGRDLPNFNYSAVIHQLAVIAGNYRLVGDQTGVVAITSVSVIDDPQADGDPATAQIILHFAKPLPDDRYTLTVSDNITDPAGNKLDGENNADKPDGAPNFPSGDGVSGGSFTTRFTVDSRPEIGIWSSSSAQLDINGNFLWDPTNADQTNRDLTLVFGNTSDYAFVGDFTDLAGNFEGFDKVGIYGRINGQWQWRVDTNNDGVIDLTVADPANINGFPIAGNFDNNAANGDEVGVFDGANFWLDTNHDYKVDTKIASNLRGHPIAGDFDGDGTDDLATYRNDTGDFQFDLSGAGGLNGTVDGAIHFDFPGVMQRPVAADMDQDGIDDIGLRVAGDNFAGSQGVAEWYFLISNQTPIEDDDREDGVGAAAVFPGLAGTVNALNHPFSPAPLGNDLFARFGDELGVPLVGNFDPPLTSQAAPPKVDNSALGQANTLVKALYRDILGRQADTGGLNYFASKVVAGATSQVIANQLLTSPEYYGKLVDSFYATYLHRQADAGGRASWVAQLSAGATSDQIVASFLTSGEYASKNNGNAAFVDGLYRDILGRNADAGGRASWTNLLNSGTSKKDVITGFLTSQERREKLVDQVYRQMLNHGADTAGKQLYSAKLLATDFTLLSLEAALAASDEYFSKVYGKS